MIYWDSSCAIKLYVDEPDSSSWHRLALESGDDGVSSTLTETELGYALLRKELEGDIGQGEAATLMAAFRRHAAEGLWRLFPAGRDIQEEAMHIGAACYRSSPPLRLRTIDGLHLATARKLGCSGVATADRRMRAAARLLGIPLTTPMA